MAEPSQTRWLRVVWPLADIDPWTLLAPLQADGARLMAWSSPKGSARFVAVGAVAEFRPCGPNRFKEAEAWWAPFADTMHTQDQDGQTVSCGAPACLAGFAFRPDSNRTPAWDAWGDGALCVPKTVFWRNGDSAVACVIVDTSTENVAEQLAKHRAQISDWIDRANTIDVAADNTAVTALPDADDAQEQWENRVVSAQAAMASGKLQKVVLARSAAFRPHPHQRFDPLCTAWALRSRQIESTTFIIRRKDGQAFLGSSPEVLVELRGNRVSTVALAGTRKRDPQSGSKDDALGNALLQSPKDRAEQRLVETAIVEALRPHVREIEVPTAPVIVRHPDVQHLKTTIQGQLTAQSTIFDLLAKLHPTPAVGGLPKADALAWLNNNESLDRGWYAGPIGWINQAGEGVFVVAIRSVLMAHESASAFAGCGLIADSNPTDEWEESQIKLQTVRQGLAQHACNGRNR